MPQCLWAKSFAYALMHAYLAADPPPPLPPELATQFMYVRNMAPHHIFTFGRFVPPFVVCVRV